MLQGQTLAEDPPRMNSGLLSWAQSPATFREANFEESFFVHRRALAHPPISWSEVNELIYVLELGDHSLRVYQDGFLSMDAYSDTYLDVDGLRVRLAPERLKTLLREGATCVVNRVERKSSVMGRLCLEVERFAGARTVANGYVALGSDRAAGFGKHWDTHDVFAVQVLGKKRWRLFGSTFELPLAHQKSIAFKDSCPSTAVFDEILEEGDLLYIPRGWWHEAIPIPGQPTFHVAFGTHTAKTIDYLKWLCAEILPAYRGSRSTLDSADPTLSSLEAFASILNEQLLDASNVQNFAKKLQELGGISTEIDLHSHPNGSLEVRPNNLDMRSYVK